MVVDCVEGFLGFGGIMENGCIFPRVFLLMFIFVAGGVAVLAGEGASQKWRQEIACVFKKDALFLKQIVLEGEDARYKAEFSKQFEEQDKWMDEQLGGPVFLDDDVYKDVVEAQRNLHAIAVAQKKADDWLVNFSKKMGFSPDEVKRIRLLILYGLTEFMQKNRAVVEIPFRSIQEVVVEVIRKMTKSINFSLGKFVDRVVYMDTILKGVGKKDEQKERELLEQELLVKQLRAELARLASQVQEVQHMKQELRSKLEKQEKRCLHYELLSFEMTRRLSNLKE